MTFPLRELLQLSLGSCVLLALMVLGRDLTVLAQKIRAKLSVMKKSASERTPASGMPALESKLD